MTHTLRLVYAGRRDGDKRLFYLEGMEDQSEGSRLYSNKMKGAAIGGLYTVEATEEDGQSVYSGTLEFVTGLAVDEEMVARWQLADQASRARLERDKAERRLAKSDELDRIIEPLLEFTATLRTRNDLAALEALVHSRMAETFWRSR